MYNVFIVDDEPSVLEGMRIMVPWEQYDFVLCGEASNTKDALRKIIELRPHLLITDIRMPFQSGLQMIAEIKKMDIDLELVILSGYADFSYAREAMRNQVIYYMLKPIDMDEIKHVLQMVKDKLDSSFLKRSGFTQEDIDAFRFRRSELLYGDTLRNDYSKQKKGIRRKTIRNSFDDELSAAVRLMNYEDAEKLVNELFGFFDEEGSTLADVNFTVNSLIYNILHIAYERNIRVNTVLLNDDDSEMNIQKLKKKLITIMSTTIALMLDERRKTSRSHQYSVKEYIEKNFDKELSVAALSEMEFLEAGYLGEAFSKQFGCSISEYQHRLRIRKAIELIKSSKMSLHDIASSVGYNNYNNFFSHFEKITHKKPMQYKEQT